MALLSHRRQRKSFYYAGLLNTGVAFWFIADHHHWFDKPWWAIVLVVAFHHAVYDQWSGAVFVRELLTCYDAALAGRQPELPELPVLPEAGDVLDPNFQHYFARAELEDELRAAGLEPVAYATDGAMFGDLKQLCVIGPGDIAQAHTSDEWIALEQLERGTGLYSRMIEEWCVKGSASYG